MKLLGSTESKITKYKNDEKVPHLEIVELVSVHCNLVNNDYQQDSRILYVINLDEYSDIGTHWIALYVNNKTVTYFDTVGVEHIPKEIKKIFNNKNIIANIFRLQAYDSVMCGYFCIGFIDFLLKGNNLTYFTNLFSPNNF